MKLRNYELKYLIKFTNKRKASGDSHKSDFKFDKRK